MTALAPTLEAFLTERLMAQRAASPNTVASYRDTFRLLLRFAAERTGKRPSALDFSDLDAVLIGAFLEHLEAVRGNSVRTRNNRLAAVHSLFGYSALRHPEHAATIQRVLAIPVKLSDRKIVTYLNDDEVDALLGACDLGTWAGRRDQALLDLAVEAGPRISELAAVRCSDVTLGRGANLHVTGKGRKERQVPFGKGAVRVLRAWLPEAGGDPAGPLFPTTTGSHMSRDAIERRVTLHVKRGPRTALRYNENDQPPTRSATPAPCASGPKGSLSRSSRSSSATRTSLPPTASTSTQTSRAAEQAISLVASPKTKPGRYRAPDPLLRFLKGL